MFARQKFQRRDVASGNNVVWKRDEQGERMQRRCEGLGTEGLGARYPLIGQKDLLDPSP